MRWRRHAGTLGLALSAVVGVAAVASAQRLPGGTLQESGAPPGGLARALPSGGSGTPHDFRRDAASPAPDDREVCVFCHTPYGTPPGGAPRWQRALPPDTGFQAYATQDDPLAVGMSFDVAGMSVVCLSCHDTAQAATVTSRIDDHPFGVPYRGALPLFGLREPRMEPAPQAEGRWRLAQFPVWSNDFRRPASGLIDGRVVWWAGNGPASGRRSRSDLPLYTRRTGTLYDDVPFIECGTCHDPHGAERLFLRLSDDGGLPCRACHEK